MAERKVLNKYFPPDFDPSLLTKRKKPQKAGPKVQTVRLMTPFSMKCNTCGEYIYKGKKFNARKENSGEYYLSIERFRFYIRCTRCSAEITFMTDPKNGDYLMESGASRNFEPWRKDGEEEREGGEGEGGEEEGENAMERLESKTLDAKREMEIMDALDEIRTRNSRHERTGVDAALDLIDAERETAAKVETEEERLAREDAEIARKAFLDADGDKVRRVVEGDGALKETPVPVVAKPAIPTFKTGVVKRKKKDLGAALGIVVRKK
ncbi:Pre-mRNA-splicing factor cwf16 [Saitoella coloradoensis]